MTPTPTEEDYRAVDEFEPFAPTKMRDALAAFRAEARRESEAEYLNAARANLGNLLDETKRSEREACERIVEEKLAELQAMTPEDQDVRGQLDAEIGLCLDIIEEIRERAK